MIPNIMQNMTKLDIPLVYLLYQNLINPTRLTQAPIKDAKETSLTSSTPDYKNQFVELDIT